MGWRSLVGAFRALSPDEKAFFVASWLLAPPVSAAVELVGFDAVSGVLRRVPRLGHSSSRAAIPVERSELLVRRAFRWSIARPVLAKGGCLPQSIVQYTVHTLAGDDVRLVVGVPRSPKTEQAESFEAHAWVARSGEPRTDIEHAVLFELGG